jgi:hypothetical protein
MLGLLTSAGVVASVPAASANPLCLVLNPQAQTIARLTITGGNFSGLGGGIFNGGTLALHSVQILGNNAGVDGGGIFSVGR